MVKNVISIEKSKAGRAYATDSKGSAMFPQTPAIGEKLVAGCWVNVVERLRDQTRDEKGELVKLDRPVTENIITAVFHDKTAALKANTADAMFELESNAFLKQQEAAIAATYKIDAKSLEAAL